MHQRTHWRHLLVATAAAIRVAVPATGSAQQPARVDSLIQQIRALSARVDSLSAELARMKTEGAAVSPGPPADTGADALAALRAAAAAAVGADTAELKEPAPAPKDVEFVGRQRNLSQFNPEISATGDLFAVVDTDRPSTNSFVPREFELALQSNLDPYSRAKVFVAHHSPGAEVLPFTPNDATPSTESETEIEEGYAEWVNLPGGFGVTVGKFRQRFGTLNRWHAHALPTQMLPIPYTAFLGEEGLAQTGVSVHWLVPLHGAGTYEVWTELTRSSDDALFGDSRKLSALGHINGFWTLSPSTYFELGASALGGTRRDPVLGTDVGARLYGVDFSFDWRPPERALYRELSVRGGAVASRAAGTLDDAWGAFGIAEYKLAQQWIAGATYQYTEDPLDATRHSWLVAPTLTWWQSEFVRLRAEFDYLQRPTDTLRQFLIQTTFAMGPHKHETY